MSIVDFGDEAWDTIQQGSLTSPDGRRLTRGGSRLQRAKADALVRQGAPVVVYWFGGQQLTWFDGQDAAQAWDERRRHYTSNPPRPTSKEMTWTGSAWTDERNAAVLVLTGHC